MADSGDDEYDRKRRDKFRGERAADAAAYSSRGNDRTIRARDDWPERDAWSRPRPRDYAGRVRDRGYSPSIEPAMKRPRTDYYGGDYFGGGFAAAAASAYHPAAHRREMATNQGVAAAVDPGNGQPPMLSFKAFLATQDDNISDSEAIEKYNDYKLEFQRQQLNEFFVAHKDDEWFRIKYHPEDSSKRKEEQTNFIKKRVEIFVDLFKEGRLSTSLDCVHTNALVKLLDTVVIKLEGGTDEDIAALDKEYEEKEEPRLRDKDKDKEEQKSEEIKETKEDENKDNEKEDGEDGELEDDKKEDGKSDDDEKEKKEEVNGEDVDMKTNTKVDEAEPTEEVKVKDKAEPNNSDSDDGAEKQDEPEKDKTESEEKMDVEPKDETAEELKAKPPLDVEEKDTPSPVEVVDKKKETVKVPKDKKRKRSRSFSGSSSSSSTTGSGSTSDSETDNEKLKDKDKPVDQFKSDEAKEITNGKKVDADEEEKDAEDDGEEKEQNIEKDNGDGDGETEDDKSAIVNIKNEDDKDKKEDKRPAPLHKTTSIFLRSLAPTITRQEVEAMCSRYAGFLRVALADPQPERRWQRRGWVTFRRDANIKEICWALNNARLRDCELGAIMNRDLSRRIRPVSGIAAHKSVVRTDIRVAARVAVHMDGKYGLWTKDGDQHESIASIEQEDKFTPFGFLSHNPVLHNITDYLIEEASAEEDLLLGLEPSGGDDIGSIDGTNVQIERDDSLVSVLDRIVLYLRIVHSIDYYNHCEYPNEDEMPSRCGILHARGPTPTARTDVTHLLGAQAENRMANFLPEVASAKDVLAQGGAAVKVPERKKTDNDQKLILLAMKDVDGEIDKFVQANTRELAKDKWLCPLSGKKFKGPDFVRKHIFNKHAEKIDEVKKEVEFFNNYLKDSKRPTAADQHQQQQQQQAQQQGKREDMPNNNSMGYMGGGHQPQHPRSYGGYGGGGGYMGGRYGGGYGGYSRPHRGGYSHRARGAAAGGSGAEYRPLIHYRDLDAPREPEEFI